MLKRWQVMVAFILYGTAVLGHATDIAPNHQQYQQQWQQLVDKIAARTEISFEKKLALYEHYLQQLKQEYAQQPQQYYQQHSVTLSETHQCKGRPAGSTKNCGFRCVVRPNKAMYTTEAWVTFSGDSTKTTVTEEKACLKLEAKGNVKKEGQVTAIFKYREGYANYKTISEADTLFRSFYPDIRSLLTE